jgi:hypothetical protein
VILPSRQRNHRPHICGLPSVREAKVIALRRGGEADIDWSPSDE